MVNQREYIGEVYGRLTVIADLGIQLVPSGKYRKHLLQVKCVCGVVQVTTANQLLRGIKTSCGCLHKEQLILRNTRHGMFKTRTWSIWNGVVSRTTIPSATGFADYGARGITVDPRWLVFENFLHDMGEAPPGMEIDRRDNNEGYYKANCRWVVRLVNARNTRRNVYLTFNGYTACLSEWASITGVPVTTLSDRNNRKWSVEKTLTTPTRVGKRGGISVNWKPPKSVKEEAP